VKILERIEQHPEEPPHSVVSTVDLGVRYGLGLAHHHLRIDEAELESRVDTLAIQDFVATAKPIPNSPPTSLPAPQRLRGPTA
jgi:hypothetical protein